MRPVHRLRALLESFLVESSVNREKRKRYDRLEAAALAPSKDSKPFGQNYHDGQLIHLVMRDKRSFGDARWTSINWGEHITYSTVCGLLLALDEARFAKTRKFSTCLGCVVPRPRRQPLDWTTLRAFVGMTEV